MRAGELNTVIQIITLTETESDGDITQVEGTPETIRARVTQVDGSRYLKEDELVDRVVYRIECWDNDYSNNIKIIYGDLALYPIRPITRNRGKGSMLPEITILVATKVGAFASLTTE